MNKKNKILICFIELIYFLIIYIKPIDMDMMYNFTFAHNISQGLIPYKDFNMIITPFYPYILSLFTFVFDNMFSYYILWFLLNLITFYLFYNISKISKHLKENLYVDSFFAFFFSFCLAGGYNLLIICFLLYLLLIFLRINEKQQIFYKNTFIISTICILSLLTKQSYGIIILGMTGIIYLILNIKYNKSNIFKHIVLFFTVYIFWILIFLLFLFRINALSDFFDFAILGITAFNNELGIKSILYILLSIFILIFIYFVSFNKLDFNKIDVEIILFFIVAIFNLSFLYPLPNGHHIICAIIGVFFVMKILFDKYNYKFIKVILFVFLTFYMFANILTCIVDTCNSEQLYIKNCRITKEYEENIILINNYINENDENNYYIITENSMMFNLNRNVYFKYYDLFFSGNIGTKKHIDLIKEIENDYIIIYSDPEKDFWQLDSESMDYIRQLNKIDEIGEYTVYSKKNN